MSSDVVIKNLNVSYNGTHVVKNVSFEIQKGKITAIIGPSGCGKTTILRSVNRLSEMTKDCKVQGEIYVDGENVLKLDTVLLRRKVGMVFQRPNPFPKSIKENVLYGLKAANIHADHTEVIKSSLEKAALWDELQHRLNDSAINLSVGQQQRLCMARSLAVSPEVILLDEPASALDPVSTLKLEESIVSMRGLVTQVIVTHNMQEARRIADNTAFIYRGELIEYDETEAIFSNPKRKETQEYIAGKFS
jgi:phosphate transport system ATP-binding protein